MLDFQDLFQWDRFITPTIIKTFYWLVIGLIVLFGLSGIFAALGTMAISPLRLCSTPRTEISATAMPEGPSPLLDVGPPPLPDGVFPRGSDSRGAPAGKPSGLRRALKATRARIPETLKASTARSPLLRIGIPDEIAGAAVLMGSSAGDFMTGQTIVIDGGATIS